MLTRKRKDHPWRILGERKMMVVSQLEGEHIVLQVEEKMEIEEMTGIEEMIEDTTGTGEMIVVHLAMIGTGKMTEVMRGGMTGVLLTTGMTVQDHLGTRELLLNHQVPR